MHWQPLLNPDWWNKPTSFLDRTQEWDEIIELENSTDPYLEGAMNLLEYCPPKKAKVIPYEKIRSDGERAKVLIQTEPDITSQTSRGGLKEIGMNTCQKEPWMMMCEND